MLCCQHRRHPQVTGLQSPPASARREAVGRELTTLGEALRAALSRLPAGGELASFPIWTEWADVVGATIARHATPRRLRRGVLVVEVDGVEWMHELQYLKSELRARLNERLGHQGAVREIFLALAGAADEPVRATPPPRRP
jgi:predicted nucleic acid-binding Zn ribbon protein